MLPPSNSKDGYIASQIQFSGYLRDARIKRGLSVVEVAEQVGVSTAEHLFLGDQSSSTEGCEPERIVQDVEAADPGDAGDGGGWIGSDPAQTASTLSVTAAPERLEVGDGGATSIAETQ